MKNGNTEKMKKLSGITALVIAALISASLTSCSKNVTSDSLVSVSDEAVTSHTQESNTASDSAIKSGTADSASDTASADSTESQSQDSAPANQNQTDATQETVHEHTFVQKTIDADCTNGAYILFTCSTCKTSYTEEISGSEPLGHDYATNVIVVEATPYSSGTRRFSCSRCGDTTDEAYGYAHTVTAYDGVHTVYGYWDTACEDEIYALTNEYRVSLGMRTLSRRQAIQDTARLRALEIAYSYRHNHSRPTNEEWLTAYPDTSRAGENIASGQEDANEVTTGWIESPSHQENIVNTSFTYIGIGVFIRVDCPLSGEVNEPDAKGLSHEDYKYYVQSFE